MQIDLFCRVVDNYGDIGVCWRLARRLAHGHGAALRLWVDDLHSFARIEPGVDAAAARQAVQGIEVRRWSDAEHEPTIGNVVIEAFACDPPGPFVARMAARAPRPLWINLEYLSAEAWIDDCHGLPSPQPDGLEKAFFFPGFSPRSGGLLREPGLIAERDAWRADAQAQHALLARLGLPPRPHAGRLITLFCYPQAPALALREGLAALPGETLLAVPQGVAPDLPEGRHGRVTVARYPMVPQPDFDRLLWTADVNFVRGEDSFVRAHWAGRPLVWQIYPQDEDAHLDKLGAWRQRTGAPPAVSALELAWNGVGDPAALPARVAEALAEPALAAWRGAAAFGDALAQQPDLADRLMAWVRHRLVKSDRI